MNRLLIGMCFTKLLAPEAYIPFLQKISDKSFFAKVGGIIKERSLQFHPTLRTVVFLFSGDDKEQALFLFRKYSQNQRLFTSKIIAFQQHPNVDSISYIDCEVHLSPEYVERIDAENLEITPQTKTGWNQETGDLFENVILTPKTKSELTPFLKYLSIEGELAKLNSKHLKTNYVVVFTGEPGTGKTLMAKRIGEHFKQELKIVNLASIVSKYVGETEKNLDQLFKQAESSKMILFFDEADALFSKRTEVKGANDKYANQETAFLLQRLEQFKGAVILATNVQNFTQSFDKAFHRRIRKIVPFDFPDEEQRNQIWKLMMPDQFAVSDEFIEEVSKNYQLTGANINNIISNIAIEVLSDSAFHLNIASVTPLIQDELKRCGKLFKVVTDEMVTSIPESRLGWNIKRGNF